MTSATGMPGHLWADSDLPAPDLRDILTQLAHFFDQLGYTKTFSVLLKEAAKNDITVDIAEWERGINDVKVSQTLMAMWEAWHEQKQEYPRLPNQDDEVEESSSSESEEDEDDDEDDQTEGKKAGVVDDEAESTSDDDAGSGSDAEDSSDEDEAQAGTKRKRVMTPDSSEASDEEMKSGDESDSDSDSDSSDEDASRPAKRAKVSGGDASSDSSSASDSSSDSDESSSESSSDAKGGVDVHNDASSVSEADSSAASSSESEDADSESSSSSDDSSSDESDEGTPAPKENIKEDRSGSATSSTATLDAQSPPPALKKGKKAKDQKATSAKTEQDELLVPSEALDEEDPTAGMHPDRLKRMPATTETARQLKKANVPFSRIPADTKVDPRFASNEYVSYEYADKAFQDLSVTKGKGFTKEKNKKKRGAYRGGAIDFTPKGIKFDD